MEDENKNGAETASEAATELHAAEQEDKKEAETPVEPSIVLLTVEKAGTPGSSGQLLALEQGSKQEVETPVEVSTFQNVEQETKDETETPAEASIHSEPPSAKSSEAREKMVNKSAAKSMLNTKKRKAALKVMKKIVKKSIEKKIKGASMIINKGSRNGEETGSAKEEYVKQENNEQPETPPDVSNKSQTSELETGKEAEMPTETSIQEAKAKSLNTTDRKPASNRVQKRKRKKNKGASLVLNEGLRNSEDAREPASNGNPQIGSVIGGKGIARNKREDISHCEDKNGKRPALDDINDSGKMQSEQGKEEEIKRKRKRRKNDQSHNSNNRAENLNKKEELDNMKVDKGKKAKERKEKIGGLIFMCSTKTKPDCLNYRIMGVSESQKDMVLRVKPGLKLFLYDFDLKLMYGIYTASSAGGKRLEPQAFGGAFPYQVRFKIHVDCFPLPDSIFRKAMVENFITKHKFQKELTFKQVSMLTELFRPVDICPSLRPRLNNLPASSARKERGGSARKERTGDKDARLRVRESRHPSHRETLRTDHYAGRDERRFPLLPHERDQLIAHREVRDEPREMFLSEKEYRAYGLRGEWRDSDLPRRAALPVDPYRDDYERRRLSDAVYRDAVPEVPARRDYIHEGPSYSGYRDYQPYSYDTRREYLPADRYLDYRRRADVSSFEAYWADPDRDLRRREIDPVDRVLYPRSPRAECDLMRRYRIMDPDPASLPVSSRYSFAGPR